MRPHAQQRRERRHLDVAVLLFALILCTFVFGLLALAATNTGAVLGYGFVAVLAATAGLLIGVEELVY